MCPFLFGAKEEKMNKYRNIVLCFILILLIYSKCYSYFGEFYIVNEPVTKIDIYLKYGGRLPLRIAVLPIEESDKDFAAKVEYMMMDLRHQVITRTEIEKILEEHKLSLSGLLEEENNEIIGKLANVYGLAFCHINREEETGFIKLIDVVTGKIIYTTHFGGTIVLARREEELHEYDENELKKNQVLKELIEMQYRSEGSAIPESINELLKEINGNEIIPYEFEELIGKYFGALEYCLKHSITWEFTKLHELYEKTDWKKLRIDCYRLPYHNFMFNKGTEKESIQEDKNTEKLEPSKGALDYLIKPVDHKKPKKVIWSEEEYLRQKDEEKDELDKIDPALDISE